MAEFLVARGEAVVIIDDGPESAAVAERRSCALRLGATVEIAPSAKRLAELVSASALVVPSPGVKPNHACIVAARAADVPVRSEIDIAAQALRTPMIAVTGTNGKTTTVEMIAALLRSVGLNVAVGGNIGTPLVSFVGTTADVMIAEVSSFQLEFTTTAWQPSVAVLLNIAEDHLDWHGTFDAYINAKRKVFANQDDSDTAILNIDDPIVLLGSQQLRGHIETVSIAREADWSVNDAVLTHHGSPIVAVDDLHRALPHDLTNALVATAAARAICSQLGREIPVEDFVGALKNYETLPHRVQFIGENQGVKYYNDSKATNPHAVLRAVESFDSVVLLAGGLNKGLDLGSLRSIASRLRGVVAFGAATADIQAAFHNVVPVVAAKSMSEMVAAGSRMAQPGDVVLLSPGCASFDMYEAGYTARGDDFIANVEAFIQREQTAS